VYSVRCKDILGPFHHDRIRVENDINMISFYHLMNRIIQHILIKII